MSLSYKQRAAVRDEFAANLSRSGLGPTRSSTISASPRADCVPRCGSGCPRVERTSGWFVTTSNRPSSIQAASQFNTPSSPNRPVPWRADGSPWYPRPVTHSPPKRRSGDEGVATRPIPHRG